MVLRFAGFELDRARAELRGPDGEAIKLRPKTLGMLTVFTTRPGRIVSKQELMDAVWPNVHVGDDSSFQCIREIRTALGDDQRQLIKLVSGRGYLFGAEVSTEATSIVPLSPSPDPTVPLGPDATADPVVAVDPTPPLRPSACAALPPSSSRASAAVSGWPLS